MPGECGISVGVGVRASEDCGHCVVAPQRLLRSVSHSLGVAHVSYHVTAECCCCCGEGGGHCWMLLGPAVLPETETSLSPLPPSQQVHSGIMAPFKWMLSVNEFVSVTSPVILLAQGTPCVQMLGHNSPGLYFPSGSLADPIALPSNPRPGGHFRFPCSRRTPPTPTPTPKALCL